MSQVSAHYHILALMTSGIAQAPDEAPRTPAGLILVDGKLIPRRHGMVRVSDLTCIHGHNKIEVRGRPYEVSIPCTYKLPPDWKRECGALVYMINTRHRGVVWMMDVTAEEDAEIAAKELSLKGIIERFGVGIPRRRYQDRHGVPPTAHR